MFVSFSWLAVEVTVTSKKVNIKRLQFIMKGGNFFFLAYKRPNVQGEGDNRWEEQGQKK